MKYLLKSLIAAAFITLSIPIFFIGCNDGTNTPINGTPSGSLINHTDCKYGVNRSTYSDGHTSNEDCVDYIYTTEGTLQLTHVNTGFNCCPGELTAQINIEDNLITIEEFEEEAGCHCNCLYDIVYQIDNLSPGNYTIKIISPYVTGEEYLESQIDLNSSPTGSFCVTRDYYPWGIN